MSLKRVYETTRTIKIKRNFLIEQERIIDTEATANQNLFSTDNQVCDRKAAKSKLGDGSKRKIKLRITEWAEALEFWNLNKGKRDFTEIKFFRKKEIMQRFSFITLTIPNQKEITGVWTKEEVEAFQLSIKRDCLNRFLIYAKRLGVFSRWFWKAELTKAGMIHFHLITDEFIEHTILKDIWNKAILTNEYVENYCKKTGATDMNSTDVHSTKGVKNLVAYVLKYVCKDVSSEREEGEGIRGNLYGFSDNLKKLSECVVVYSSTRDGGLQINEQIDVVDLISDLQADKSYKSFTGQGGSFAVHCSAQDINAIAAAKYKSIEIKIREKNIRNCREIGLIY